MARRQVNIYINGREVAKQLTPLRAEKRKIVRELNHMTIGSDEYKAKIKELDEVNGILNKHRDNVRGTSSAWNQAGTSIKAFAGLAAAKISADAIVEFGKQMLETGTALEAIENNAQIIFEDSLPKVEAAAKANAAQMGLTNNQYKDFASNIADVLKPMGFFPDEAANMATSTINLSGALAEWTKGRLDSAQVSDILKSALTGERESLKQLGIVISEADVKARLAEKGLTGLTGKMLEQAKAAATLELITEKSLDAQNAFAENSDTMARKQATLTARLTSAKEEIATALIPVFDRLLEYALPIVDTFADFISVLFSGEKATGKYSGAVNVMATVIKNTGKVIGVFWNALKGLAGFMLTTFGPAIEFIGTNILRLYNVSVRAINGLQEFLNIDTLKLEPVNIDEFKASLEAAKNAVKESKVEEPVNVPVRASTNGNVFSDDREADLRAAAKAEKEAKRLEKEEEREAKALQKKYERLMEISERYQEDARLSKLEEEDRKLAEIAAKFDVEIEKAKELETAKVEGATELRLQLENQKEEALKAQREVFEQEREEKRKELVQRIQEEVATDLEAELLRMEEHYLELIQQADQFGIDTYDLKERWKQEEQAIADKYRQQELDAEKKKIQDELKLKESAIQQEKEIVSAKIGLARTVVSQLSAIAGENTTLQVGLFLFEKSLAAAEVLVSLQKQLALIQVKYAAIPGGVALAAAESVKAKVDAGIRIATIAGTSIQRVSQKKKGGYHYVKGKDDGITYQARFIGAPRTGMLPNVPVVLASEAGREYFVDNESLKKPAILQHVQAIENLKHAKQFVDGGFNLREGTAAPTPSTTDQPQVIMDPKMVAVLNRLAEILDRGVPAILEDETLVRIPEKLAELDEGSGGVITG